MAERERRERGGATQIERVEKKNNYAFNIFSFGSARRTTRRWGEREKDSESVLPLTTELQSHAKSTAIERAIQRRGARGLGNGKWKMGSRTA